MWTAGYVAEVDYTHGFYHELAPHRMRLAALSRNLSFALDENTAYLELGFGQGLSLNINAAANPGRYWGNDFNPVHAENAAGLARAGKADLTVLDASFEELAARPDLPEFDIIALHGIWSWISDANRAVIVDIVRRRLKPGGLFYISYNTTPGWAPSMPLRHLMVEHADRAGTGAIAARIDAAIDYARRMADAGAAYFKANPAIVERLDKMKDHDRHYLAHEYFNADWHPMPFSRTAGLLEAAKLGYAASAHLLDHVDAINLTADAQEFLGAIDDPLLKETTRDYFVNQQFRRDLFVKGGRRLPGYDQLRAFRAMPFMLLRRPEDVALKTTGALGEATLQEEVYGPVIETLAAGGPRPRTIADLADSDACRDISIPQIVQAMLVLCGKGDVAPAHDGKTAAAVARKARALNSELCRRAETAADSLFLAAPLIGSAVPANRFEQLFLRARELKHKDAPAYVWQLLSAQGQRLVEDGKTIESEEDNLAQLRARHQAFETRRLPIFKQLMIV